MNTVFGGKMLYLRQKNNLTQEDLADKLEVSRQTVSKWESGATYPEIEKLVQISELYGVSIDFLLKDAKTSKDIEEERLERVVLRFLGSAQDMEDISEQLIDIMKDGVIDEQERIEMERINGELDTIIENINKIKKIAAAG